MKHGELFELESFQYLQEKFGSNSIHFSISNTADSTQSDIAVYKNEYFLFYIEVKASHAQSGQFVLIPNYQLKIFEFSSRNHSQQNEITNKIIDFMNSDFDRFVNAGTRGENIKLDSSLFESWITKHYKNLCVKYFISYNDGFVIIPIEKFSEYFSINAKYRVKKSGSRPPAKKDYALIIDYLYNTYGEFDYIPSGSRLFVRINKSIDNFKFVCGNNSRYFLAHQGGNAYEVRNLSNTSNMNVIFSISIKKKQEIADLLKFKKDLM